MISRLEERAAHRLKLNVEVVFLHVPVRMVEFDHLADGREWRIHNTGVAVTGEAVGYEDWRLLAAGESNAVGEGRAGRVVIEVGLFCIKENPVAAANHQP